MKTQIKFRGFRTDGKGWVEGLPNQYQGTLRICREIIEHPSHSDPAGTWIYQEHEIHPESLGQFTGQTDKNGKEIFGAIGEKGGDVVDTPKGNAPVTFELGCFYVITRSRYRLGGWNSDCIEIIGNQFEQDNGR